MNVQECSLINPAEYKHVLIEIYFPSFFHLTLDENCVLNYNEGEMKLCRPTHRLEFKYKLVFRVAAGKTVLMQFLEL